MMLYVLPHRFQPAEEVVEEEEGQGQDQPGEEVAAAKVLEPPGPEVVEEGGQAPACGWAKQVALEHPSGPLDHHD